MKRTRQKAASSASRKVRSQDSTTYGVIHDIDPVMRASGRELNAAGGPLPAPSS